MRPARTAHAPRRIGIGVAGLIVTTLAASAGATVTGELGANNAPARPNLAAMPDTTLPAPLDVRAAPASVGAGERVDGLTASGTDAFRRNQPSVELTASDRRCVTAGFLSPDDGANPTQHGQISHSISQHPVAAVRTERLVVETNGAASLEIVDAWLDPGTRGVQLAKKTSVALTKLANGPEGFAVYGLRSGDVLELVVPTYQRMSALDAEGNLMTTSCDHVRVGLRAEAGAGISAVVAGPIAVTEPDAAKQVNEKLSAAKPTRVIQVSASASRTSRDPAPVISVAIRWAEEPAPAPRLPSRPQVRELPEAESAQEE